MPDAKRSSGKLQRPKRRYPATAAKTPPDRHLILLGNVNMKEVVFAGADTHVHTLGADGRLLWQFNTGDEVTQVVTTDMDGDGLDEVVASSMSFNVYVIKGDGRTVVWRADLGEVVRCISVGDFDGDGRPEVAVVHLLANGDGRTLARFRTGGALLTMAAADVDGDGIPEIAVASEDGVLYVLKR